MLWKTALLIPSDCICPWPYFTTPKVSDFFSFQLCCRQENYQV